MELAWVEYCGMLRVVATVRGDEKGGRMRLFGVDRSRRLAVQGWVVGAVDGSYPLIALRERWTKLSIGQISCQLLAIYFL